MHECAALVALCNLNNDWLTDGLIGTLFLTSCCLLFTAEWWIELSINFTRSTAWCLCRLLSSNWSVVDTVQVSKYQSLSWSEINATILITQCGLLAVCRKGDQTRFCSLFVLARISFCLFVFFCFSCMYCFLLLWLTVPLHSVARKDSSCMSSETLDLTSSAQQF